MLSPVRALGSGDSPNRRNTRIRGRSSNGRASALHADGCGFESHRFHHSAVGKWLTRLLWEQETPGSSPGSANNLPMKPDHDYFTLRGIRANCRVLESGCWYWEGYKDRKGYGQFKRNQRGYKAHRSAWCAANQQDLDQLQSNELILHTCDNPPCCNPDHLRLGTHAANMADMAQKGRAYNGGYFGECNGNAKLSRKQALRIYKLAHAGTRTQKDIASEFGVTLALVSRIKLKKSWSHIH